MICSTCGYIIRDGQWLMLFRNKKKDDVNAGKWIGVGGKQEEGETPLECMIRETQEETGLTMLDPCYRGMVYFIYEDRETELIRIYTCQSYEGDLKECREGTLAWIPQDQLDTIPVWEGDRLFLKRLTNDEDTLFTLYLYYDRHGNLLKAEEGEE
ncbi:MAG: 8-oxo-dGTP diphosphatase [Solobacterium sp.]|nr:8-oxo-dGTP diphosphatase [Solobacterium sp.]